MPHRRPCFAKRLYTQATPYIQLFGWVFLVASVVFSAGMTWNKVSAYEGRLNTVEGANMQMMIMLQRIDQRVSDMYDRSK